MIHPFIKPFTNEQVWLDFFDKYQIMAKESIYVSLKNTARQHRGMKRFCKEMSILIAEANFTDETILSENNMQVAKHNSVNLILAIRMTQTFMLRYLN